MRGRAGHRRSPRAYEHWLRARLAVDPARVADQLLLARVYDERSSRLSSELVRARLAQGKPRLARRALDGLRRIAGSSAEVARLEARLAEAEGRLDRAIRFARRAVERSGAWQDRQYLADLLLSPSGDPVRAEQILQAAARAHPDRSAPSRRLAALRAEMGDLEGARVALESAAARAVDPTGDLLQLAELDHRLGRDRLAAERIVAVLARAPGRAEPRRRALQAVLRIVDLRRAESVATEGLALGTLDVAEIARAYADEGVFPASGLARRWLRAASAALDPGARAELAGSDRAALRLLAGISVEDPGYLSARLLLADRLRDRGRIAAAQRALRSGLEAATASVSARLSAELDRLRADLQGEIGSSTSPWDDLPGGVLDRVSAGQALAEDRAAIRKARSERPDHPGVLALAGRWATLRRDARHGRDDLERAARLGPREATIWAWLSAARAADGDDEGARAAAARAERRRAADARARRPTGPDGRRDRSIGAGTGE